MTRQEMIRKRGRRVKMNEESYITFCEKIYKEGPIEPYFQRIARLKAQGKLLDT